MSRTTAILRSEYTMAGHDKVETIRKLFSAYKTENRKIVEDTLTSDFRFTSPYDDRIDKATYFERCWPAGKLIEEHTIEKIFVEGNEAFVQYKARMAGKEFRNTEFFVFEGPKVKRIDVYFGAAYKNGSFVKQPTMES